MKRFANWLRAIADRLNPPKRFTLLAVKPKQMPRATGIAGSALCTAKRCSIQPFHSPCAYQTALAAKRETKRKPAIKPTRKTAKMKA